LYACAYFEANRPKYDDDDDDDTKQTTPGSRGCVASGLVWIVYSSVHIKAEKRSFTREVQFETNKTTVLRVEYDRTGNPLCDASLCHFIALHYVINGHRSQ